MKKSLWWSFFLFTILSFSYCTQDKTDSLHRYGAISGNLDAEDWNFSEKPLALTGEWIFFQSELLTTDQCRENNGVKILFPQLWNDFDPSGKGTGFGTYYLRVYVPGAPPEMILQIPQLYNSYALWINEKLVASNGKVGKAKEETVPQWLPQSVTFELSKDTLEIVLQIANFHHHKGGAREPIYLGSKDQLSTKRSLALGSNIAESILLFLSGLAFLALYFQEKKKKIILYFSLLCITWSLRSVFSNLYTFIYFFPEFDWNTLLRIEYITLYLSIIWSILFLSRLFKTVSNQTIKYMLVTANIFFVIFTVFAAPVTFTRWLSVYLSVAGITLVYSIIIILRALMFEQPGVWPLVASIFLGILLFGYDMIGYQWPFAFNVIITNVGYIVIFVLIMIALLIHLDILKIDRGSSTVLTYKDLYNDDPASKSKR